MGDRIVIYTHNRIKYFELTMDALLHSLQDVTLPITIVLNKPTEQIKQLCATKYTRFDILECKDNIAFAATNVAIQWYHDIDNIIIIQDDHILPRQTRMIYYRWPHLFINKLNEADIVFFSCSLDNVVFDFPKHQPSREDNLFYYWDDAQNHPAVFLFQPCAISVKFWKQCYISGAKCAYDTAVVQKARKMITAKHVVTYHIGWNGEMDGYNDRNIWAKAFHIQEKVDVTSWTTGETRTILLDDVIKES